MFSNLIKKSTWFSSTLFNLKWYMIYIFRGGGVPCSTKEAQWPLWVIISSLGWGAHARTQWYVTMCVLQCPWPSQTPQLWSWVFWNICTDQKFMWCWLSNMHIDILNNIASSALNLCLREFYISVIHNSSIFHQHYFII